MIPSLLCGFLTHLLLLKNSAAEGMHLIFGMSVCFFQTFLTIGAFNWLKKASPDEKKESHFPYLNHHIDFCNVVVVIRMDRVV